MVGTNFGIFNGICIDAKDDFGVVFEFLEKPNFEIGEEAGKRYGVKYLFADFKKKDGYRRSIELSREYGLYRQAWCGCGWPEKEA